MVLPVQHQQGTWVEHLKLNTGTSTCNPLLPCCPCAAHARSVNWPQQHTAAHSVMLQRSQHMSSAHSSTKCHALLSEACTCRGLHSTLDQELCAAHKTSIWWQHLNIHLVCSNCVLHTLTAYEQFTTPHMKGTVCCTLDQHMNYVPWNQHIKLTHETTIWNAHKVSTFNTWDLHTEFAHGMNTWNLKK